MIFVELFWLVDFVLSVLPTCMSVYQVHEIASTGVKHGFKTPYRFWESSPNPLEEQSMLLTSEVRHQPGF